MSPQLPTADLIPTQAASARQTASFRPQRLKLCTRLSVRRNPTFSCLLPLLIGIRFYAHLRPIFPLHLNSHPKRQAHPATLEGKPTHIERTLPLIPTGCYQKGRLIRPSTRPPLKPQLLRFEDGSDLPPSVPLISIFTTTNLLLTSLHSPNMLLSNPRLRIPSTDQAHPTAPGVTRVSHLMSRILACATKLTHARTVLTR